MKIKRCAVVQMSNEVKVLRELRKENKLSMLAAGSLIGKSDSYISQLENGRADLPSKDLLLTILDIYETTYSEYQKRVKNYQAPKAEILNSLLKKLNESQMEQLISTTQMLLAS